MYDDDNVDVDCLRVFILYLTQKPLKFTERQVAALLLASGKGHTRVYDDETKTASELFNTKRSSLPVGAKGNVRKWLTNCHE